jgi:hypothetical protein
VTSERAAALATLAGWTSIRNGTASPEPLGGSRRGLRLHDPRRDEAEKADHHPEWSNVWNRVDIMLSTHSAGGVTAKDIALAAKIEAIAA